MSPFAEWRRMIRPYAVPIAFIAHPELNRSYNMGNYFARAMLTRGVLNHVPPVFGKASFGEVANNYSGGRRSFKETMHQLETQLGKLPTLICTCRSGKRKTLPAAQQVNFAPQLDVLLSEIVRITI
jgi:hypothetical protein